MERVVVDAPIGALEVVADGRELVAIDFRPGPDVRAGTDSAGAADALAAYFAGDLSALDRLRLKQTGTPFQQRVWSALRAVPPGETISYSALAAEAGYPRAIRAVGTANGANPVPIVVPCHRVIRADGTIGGYGGGLDRKRWLLEHEQRVVAAIGG